MEVNSSEVILDTISKLHSNDKHQLNAIFSQSKRLIIEAPAGYGKTKTMVSKIAYLLSTNRVNKNKKILALSFSVNAAFKIKKEVTEQLPELMGKINFNINEKIFISNYHGLCRHIVKLYGYLIHENLRGINNFIDIDDSDKDELVKLGYVNEKEAGLLSKYNEAVKYYSKKNSKFIKEHWDEYLDIVCGKFISQNHITFNAILMLAKNLLQKYNEIREYYQKYFEVIIIDEFQDTNLLSLLVINLLTESIS